MDAKYRIHNGPTPRAIEQGARIGANMVIVYSVGPCSSLRFERDAVSGRHTDEFPQYFDDYPKVSGMRRSADSAWLEPLRREVRALCDQADGLGMRPVFHLYEPMLPLAFEREYPELVGVWKRTTQEGTVDVHTLMDPDKPGTWELFKAKYRELARDFPKVGMFIITTGDTASAFWCVPDARMPIHERLANMVKAAREGVREAGSDARVCFRLWWRNFPGGFYTDGARMIGEATGLDNALDLMNPICKPHNEPSEVLPKLFKQLPDDVPVMYKSTRMDIHDNAPLTLAAGTYPAGLEQILEISYEMYHLKPWPWCKVRHIRQGLDAVREHGLAGYVSLPINMGNNTRDIDPEAGNLGRMNTWMFQALAGGDQRSDRELLAAWLEKEYGGPQPELVLDALFQADELADKGLQWGRGVYARNPFSSPHTTKLTWFSEGFVREDFPRRMADPDEEFIEGLIRMKQEAYDLASGHLAGIKAAEAAIHPELFRELLDGYSMFADVIMLQRDWHAYLLVQYAIEKGVYPPERKVLGRMSRYAETFIRNLVRLKETPAGKYVSSRISFPDDFPLS